MAKKPKYQKTKELIRIALREGLTQEHIGKLCRVGQPQVSKWKSGTAFASVDQVKPLLDKFGHLLRHSPFKVYQFGNEPGKMSFLKVEGKLLLREKFRAIAQGGQTEPPMPAATCIRISIHRQNEGRYAVVFEGTTAPAPTKKSG
jgi:transcriptional regulator with XRE-family HTH domain